MRLVVDANVLIAAFLRSATTRELLLDARLSLCAPAHSLSETEHVLLSPRLRRKIGGLSRDDIWLGLREISRRLAIMPVDSFEHRLKEALLLAPHPEDAPYLALALHLGSPLWSKRRSFEVPAVCFGLQHGRNTLLAQVSITILCFASTP